MPSTPRRFVDHFDRLVTADLQRLCRAQAYLVTCHVSTFGEAMTSVWRHAWQRGAGFLSAEVQSELREWIASELIQHIDTPTPDGLLTPEQAHRLFADIADWEANLNAEGE